MLENCYLRLSPSLYKKLKVKSREKRVSLPFLIIENYALFIKKFSYQDKSLSIMISPRLYNDLKEKARRNDMDFNDYCLLILRKFVDKYQ